ncbi:SDH family Clp fold serine proteinase [Erythrobacter westpacificensis]
MATKKNPIREIVEKVSAERDADIILYNGGIFRPCDETLIRECISRGQTGRRKNVVPILVTGGGDPDAAYRIARCLQRHYEKFTLYVSGACKSAGTLIAIGAHELLISDHGELGPLDIQMAKKDEFFGSQSGLTVSTALEALESRAFQAVERMFIEIESNTGGILSVQTATDLASKTVVGLYAPIAGQIDPMHVGEAARALVIADAYGTRLNQHSGNLASPTALNQLYTSYPSHGFVIDREEARSLFKDVSEPNENELALVEALGAMGRRMNGAQAMPDPDKTVVFLTEPVQPEKPRKAANEEDRNGDEGDKSPTADAAA